jgi:hypothetical protein
MPVVKLDSSHRTAVAPLFANTKYMGVDIQVESFGAGMDQFNRGTYEIFCNNYLRELKNFHAYGYLDPEENTIKALISFYESVEEPAWYYTLYRSSGNNNLLREVLDAVIAHNERNSRLKFYTLVHARHSRLLRRFHWSQENNQRYGYFDEFLVPSRTRCFWINHWELLYKRFILPEDSIVRCNFLKQEYRNTLPIGGNI